MDEHEHCWHRARMQHAMMNHRDETCCHCNADRCINFEVGIPKGHGRFCTDVVLVRERIS